MQWLVGVTHKISVCAQIFLSLSSSSADVKWMRKACSSFFLSLATGGLKRVKKEGPSTKKTGKKRIFERLKNLPPQRRTKKLALKNFFLVRVHQGIVRFFACNPKSESYLFPDSFLVRHFLFCYKKAPVSKAIGVEI